MVGSCECGNEPSGSIIGEVLLEERLLASHEGLSSMELCHNCVCVISTVNDE